MTPPDSMVLLDVGSTNSRGWLTRDGAILDSRSLPVGVRNGARDESGSAVSSAAAALIQALAPASGTFGVAAAGMITSAEGLAEVPHVRAPASVDDLAAGAVRLSATSISPVPILLVPGVRTSPQRDEAYGDVLRGEETLVIGLLALGLMAREDLLFNAGSHWKMIAVDSEGRIARSRTSLGGEAVHAMQTSTLLSASLPGGPLAHVLPDWLEAGADEAAREGLLRALFAVRLLDQRGDTTPEQRLAWLIGACVSDDVRALLRLGHLSSSSRVLVSGPAAVPAAWAHMLRREGCESSVLAPDAVERAFVTGLLRVVERSRQCEPQPLEKEES